MHGTGDRRMSITGIALGLLILAAVLVVCWFLTELIIPQSEIDEMEALSRWLEEELNRRETESEVEDDQKD